MPEPININQAKLQLRVDTSADDDLINDLIVTARQYVEKYCGITLIAAEATMTFPHFYALDRLTFAPVTEIAEIRYLDTTGVEQILDAATYELVNADADELRPMVRLAYSKFWPALRPVEDAVRVTASVGYATVPAPITRAMMLLITQWYDYREPIAVDVKGTPAELPNAMMSLLANYRR